MAEPAALRLVIHAPTPGAVARARSNARNVLAARPDVIIELMPEVKVTQERERDLRAQWQAIGTTPALTNGRIYFLTTDHCLIPSPRYHLIVDEVSRILHPAEP